MICIQWNIISKKSTLQANNWQISDRLQHKKWAKQLVPAGASFTGESWSQLAHPVSTASPSHLFLTIKTS